MGRISTKVNLAAFKNASILKLGKNKDVECIIIPIEQNHLFKSEKGAVYADFIGFDITNRQEGKKDTHIVKQSLPKEIHEKQTEEEKKAMPIFGNHIVWDGTGTAQSDQAAKTIATEDDLPF